MLNPDLISRIQEFAPLGPPIRKPAEYKPAAPEQWVPVPGSPAYVQSTKTGAIKDKEPLKFHHDGSNPSHQDWVDAHWRARKRGVSDIYRVRVGTFKADGYGPAIARLDALQPDGAGS